MDQRIVGGKARVGLDDVGIVGITESDPHPITQVIAQPGDRVAIGTRVVGELDTAQGRTPVPSFLDPRDQNLVVAVVITGVSQRQRDRPVAGCQQPGVGTALRRGKGH
ncbi:hypothetical protein C2E25_11485 [Geothermobacter hydrogeniphilus]|uniref:Uncharacterized protein n=1 Tax=Geothermobacter hydrogeniphilus TaxID=1969733 RepID=A0A2K2H8U2_9BACT|nr:hypothetical protein C2E25_11485 [Geothermobacter hydrogeniphilus]